MHGCCAVIQSLFSCSKGRSFNRGVARGGFVPQMAVSFCGCGLWWAEVWSWSSAIFCHVSTLCCSKPGLSVSFVVLVQTHKQLCYESTWVWLKKKTQTNPPHGFLPLYECPIFEAKQMRVLLQQKGRKSNLWAWPGDRSAIWVCFAAGSAVGAGAEWRLGHSADRLHARGRVLASDPFWHPAEWYESPRFALTLANKLLRDVMLTPRCLGRQLYRKA